MSIKLNIVKTAGGAANITGYDTFALKEAIKRCGGRWEAASKTWIVPPPCDLAPLEEEMRLLGETRKAEAKAERERRKAERAFAATPEGKAAAKAAARQRVLACLAEKAKTGAYHWICCEKCEVIDWQRQHTSCWDCGDDKGLWRDCFRVRGRIYTGD